MRDGEEGFSDAGVMTAPARSGGWLRRWRWPVMVGGPLLILAAVAVFVLTSGRSESTDNAYVQAEKVPVSASINGRVVDVLVHENQRVKKGDVLFRLDTQDLQTSLAQAQAELATARTEVMSLRAAYQQQLASIAAARETAAHAAREAVRQRNLVTAGVASAQQAADAQHAADQAQRMLAVSQSQAAVALANLGGDANRPVDRHPTVMQAQAELQRARLNVSYTEVYAPSDGIVTRVEQMPVGTYLNASQTGFWLLSGQPWVEANFKEDQLAHMKVGQAVSIKVDAYPDANLTGHVASFSPGTGSAFSALPAQNATGNWVKVVQRLPVRISFDKPPPGMAGRAGLSAKVKVDVRASRSKG